jgi:type I restriction enzyme R subunit
VSKQSEQILEEQLIAQLSNMGYAYVLIKDEQSLLQNLKSQLEKHNGIQLTDKEFDRIVNILNKGSVFEKAKTLRAKQHIVRDNGDNLYFEFINTDFWCQNEFQVTHQITMDGKYKNRYDVTLLINGLPLVQIELKRRGLELKEAFNQINRYQKHSFGTGAALFQFVQIFIISNGVNTKYYSNFGTTKPEFTQTFYWTDINNKRLTNILNGFTSDFLEPCHISKMICKYIVLHEGNKRLMVMRPYQYYAVEAIVERVKNTNKGGYIWHTTGSGKTLTSFKASQILMNLPQVKKVVFVVDRKDLDYQTSKEFNEFSAGSVDGTNNTQDLVNKFANDTKLIVTTIQKLNNAIQPKYASKMKALENEPMVFIFDECHRSQFGDTHKNIMAYFKNVQLFGFTGTPILAENSVKNALGERTTTELFGDCLHKYVITDAIKDENVLKFAIEYVGRYKQKDGVATNIDIEVEDIDTKELMEHPTRLEKIVDYIIAHHDRKTHSRKFTGMFCVSSVETLIKYYDIFQAKKEARLHRLNIATVFSFAANEDELEIGNIDSLDLNEVAEPQAKYSEAPSKHSREKLDEYIVHFNKMFGTGHSTKDTQSFYNYYNDVSKKVKEQKVDILLVVNMFLTGFDSKGLNTLYVDKNLKYHGLIQAFSRTNRIKDELKSQGNIVSFRNLKKATDDAITLFSNKDAIDVIVMKPFEDYVGKFNEAFEELLSITPSVDSVNELKSEEDELAFIKAFRDLMRLKNVLSAFADFNWDSLEMNEQQFEDYKSKYLDLHDKTKSKPEKVSILDDVDFELELIHRDEINVNYILQLLIKLKSKVQGDVSNFEKEIFGLLGSESTLRSKKELIEKFIAENLPVIEDTENVTEEFEKFWNEEQLKAFNNIVSEENLSKDKTDKLIAEYLFAEKPPLRDEVLDLIEGDKPTLLERKKIGDRILNKILGFVETFINGMVG